MVVRVLMLLLVYSVLVSSLVGICRFKAPIERQELDPNYLRLDPSSDGMVE
jgi:hypothetical protein